MHVLRGDEDGIAAQVLVHNAATVEGIARDIPDDAKALMHEFWPGALSLNLKPVRALTWDLGDNQELDLFSVRAPKSRFVKALLKESGPLAVASAARAGHQPMLKINRADVKDWDVAVVFDNGQLKSGPKTSVVEVSDSGLRIVREGAISAKDLKAVAPSISAG
jgi:tRNA A37 threonylcarbamoyladenosine synthetase subunit TsaC/SUA5/YrdC